MVSRLPGDPQLWSPPHEAVGPLYGVDFTSTPGRRKPIVVARGWREPGQLRLEGFEYLDSLAQWAHWLKRPGPWIAGLDLPLGLPRELVQALGWPQDWEALMQLYAGLERHQIRELFRQFCAGRPAGSKLAHRACDKPAGSSPSMKWVNPPVAWMLHAALPGLLSSGVSLPGLRPGDAQRLALEAYPGMVARRVLGRRSYKSDDTRLRHCPQRQQARQELLDALREPARAQGLRLALSSQQAALLLEDASADRLDAVICLLQVAEAAQRPGWGWPIKVDPLEGWILGA